MQIKDLELGLKLEVSLVDQTGRRQSPFYPVKLQQVKENILEVDMPMSNAQIVLFQVGSFINVTFTFKDGYFAFPARIVNRTRKNLIPIMVLEPVGEITRIQRRSFYRLRCNCVVRYRPFKLPVFGPNEEPFRTTNTIDISGGGMCILTNEKIEKTNFLECVIILEKDLAISVIGKVVNVKRDDTEQSQVWKIGIQFERISERERERIINYVFQEQLKLRRRGLV